MYLHCKDTVAKVANPPLYGSTGATAGKFHPVLHKHVHIVKLRPLRIHIAVVCNVKRMQVVGIGVVLEGDDTLITAIGENCSTQAHGTSRAFSETKWFLVIAGLKWVTLWFYALKLLRKRAILVIELTRTSARFPGRTCMGELEQYWGNWNIASCPEQTKKTIETLLDMSDKGRGLVCRAIFRTSKVITVLLLSTPSLSQNNSSLSRPHFVLATEQEEVQRINVKSYVGVSTYSQW